jgi:hypothetical protein
MQNSIIDYEEEEEKDEEFTNEGLSGHEIRFLNISPNRFGK